MTELMRKDIEFLTDAVDALDDQIIRITADISTLFAAVRAITNARHYAASSGSGGLPLSPRWDASE